MGIFHRQTTHLYFLLQYSTVSKMNSMAEYSTVSKMQSLNFSIFFNEMRIYNGSGIFFFYFETVSCNVLGIVHPQTVHLYFLQQYSNIFTKHSMIKYIFLKILVEIVHPQTKIFIYFSNSIANYSKCTVWFFSQIFNETRTCNAFGIIHLKNFILKHLFLFLLTV